ncbi:DEAD-box ATP-dependent RNA helicase CshA [Waddlia chondrophila 2032/99]|uniref:DEAD-box ATP-dependent RNA helicase CshA n=2 Tax=Waddlia chondrophila TaxID=71667 RepID=F8LCA2_9BACT|nr:DEAD/DEAH box helicase [Waddlia chondrophila]ADI38759.1 putative ATP-dependent RNA helicase DBP2 [Waddlia chondrophila WSU 86-1044]CCB91116.1 DEAD-box ATP-dependent RNA helicase CshA [Waddlia chondrophila 2032/99]
MEINTLTFNDFNLDPKIIESLREMKYLEPSEIQTKAIPEILNKRDVVALAQTGSGKTAACAIPLCHMVDTSKDAIQALVIVPTRELALQYATETQKIGKKRGVHAFAIYGGEDADIQEAKIGHRVHVLIATPGRLIDFIYSRRIDLSQVFILALDEADEMLSMGFYEDLEFIINCLVQEHQILLFSATMPKEIRRIAEGHMKDPVDILLTQKKQGPSSIEHRFLYCRPDQRDASLIQLLNECQPVQSIIFGRTRFQVESLAKSLQKSVKGVDFLHGALSQDVRRIVTRKFRGGKIQHLVATDVAARGLDFSEVSHVFMYEMSDDPDIYVHRSGRTGRFDKQGMVVTLVTKRDLGVLGKVLKFLKKKPQWIGHPPPERVPESKPRNRKRVRAKKDS